MNEHVLSEADVLLARNGDQAAFTRLVDRSANVVCAIGLAIARDVHASEDIAQETFLAAWKNLRTLRNPASFLPWLRQVARNQAHLWRREHEREIANDDALSRAVDARRSPADDVLADEEQRVLRDVLDALPDEAREVLVLYYREEQSSRQVAQLLGISEDGVRQRIARGRAAVREEMLRRFGTTVARTAPGAMLVSAVAGALTMTAPTASAALASSKGATALLGAKGVLSVATTIGTVLGWVGVLMGMRSLEPYFDEREGRELRQFRNLVLAVVTFGCAAVALSARSPLAMVLTLQSLYVIVAVLYAVRLPGILERRMAWEKSVDPKAAKQNRRQWMWATIGRAAAAAIGGVVLMAIVLRGML